MICHRQSNRWVRRLAACVLLASVVLMPARHAAAATQPTTPTGANPISPAIAANQDAEGENYLCTDPAAAASAAKFANLHVTSPDWRDQIIYFVMTDRFADGDPTNNDQGAGEFDPQDFSRYNGGDLQGVIDQLDYIQGLGATTVWVTPPVANQWWDPLVNFGGYHGYWAENFAATDKHMGSLETYQTLADALHGRDMYLIQDIVANHTGNFFTYQDASGKTNYNPADPTTGVRLNTETVPVTTPSQAPFDQNDVNDPAQKDAAIYHWTPTIINGSDPNQELTYQLSDLDDLNTTNPVVRDALKQAYACWIQNAGVDGFRVDTVKYVEHDFWNDFEYSEDPAAPGMTAAAAATGRDDFLTFGEAFVDSKPLDDGGDKLAGSFTGTAEKPELDGAINFPMHWTIGRVFAEGQPTNYATYSLQQAQDPTIYRNPGYNVNFVDNHDVARFLSRGSIAGLKQAMLFLLTIPGIPAIYYGTEQGFDEGRAAMFADGWMSGGVDHYNTESEMYKHIQTLANLRTGNPVFTRGTLTPLADSATGAGPLAYRRDYEGDSAIVLFNTADQPVLLTDMDTGLPEGTVLKLLFGIANQEDIVVGPNGKITMELAPREGMILQPTDEIKPLAGAENAAITIDSNYADAVLTEDFAITGTVSAPDTLVKVIINGNLASALETTADADGIFEATAPISIFPPGVTANTASAYAPDLMVVSAATPFTTEVTSTDLTSKVYDRANDDAGPTGAYTRPTDETFGKQMDILATAVSAYGSNLLLTLDMADITTVWNPRNGFDHVLFQIFIDVPGKEGVTVLPKLNANTPDGMAWDYENFVEGWTNRFTSADGATADTFGAPVTPAPTITVNPETKQISFLYPASALGNPETLEGTKVYITTWDWNGPDSALRPLKDVAAQWSFGGGDGKIDPIIFDDTDIVEVANAKQQVTVDPFGDDFGPFDPSVATGHYVIPSGPAYTHTGDLGAVVVTAEPDALRVSLQTRVLTNTQDAPNGFDQVRFHVFLDTTGEGATEAPALHTAMPAGFAYDFLGAVDGWNNTLYTPDGAGDTALGTDTGAAPTIEVNPERNAVDLVFPAAAIGSPEDLSKVKVYVTTWDWDPAAESLRALTPEGGPDVYGGGDGAAAPLWIDDVLVGAPSEYRSPFPVKAQTAITWEVTVPAGTPEGDKIFLTGAFANWVPSDAKYQLTKGDDGVYRFTMPVDAGTMLEYRITRGNFAKAEVLDPNDRLANRTLEVPEDAGPTMAVPITVEKWWDQ